MIENVSCGINWLYIQQGDRVVIKMPRHPAQLCEIILWYLWCRMLILGTVTKWLDSVYDNWDDIFHWWTAQKSTSLSCSNRHPVHGLQGYQIMSTPVVVLQICFCSWFRLPSLMRIIELFSTWAGYLCWHDIFVCIVLNVYHRWLIAKDSHTFQCIMRRSGWNISRYLDWYVYSIFTRNA